MTIVTFSSGPVTHRYLMRKTKRELVDMYFQNKDHFGGGGDLNREFLEQKNTAKWFIAHRVLEQFRRMPVDKD